MCNVDFFIKCFIHLCTAAVKQANKILGMIKRNFVDRSKETILALYKSLARPYQEYCIPVSNPYLVKDIKLIESVKRRATKMVQGMQRLNYDDRLTKTELFRIDAIGESSSLTVEYILILVFVVEVDIYFDKSLVN